MSATALVWWIVLAGAVVLTAAIGTTLLRAFGTLKTIARRVDAYVELPVVAALGRADRDAARLTAAAASAEALIPRAKAALETIRRGPVSPELVAAYRGVRTAVMAARAAFRLIRAVL
ncbi:MAG TPA: hypothetical protein VFB22_01385 [Candidatus Baltobacteraceae bacterium]|nr:hypothetical protein [Candidatus Baltobacteraceae bacterium]